MSYQTLNCDKIAPKLQWSLKMASNFEFYKISYHAESWFVNTLVKRFQILEECTRIYYNVCVS